MSRAASDGRYLIFPFPNPSLSKSGRTNVYINAIGVAHVLFAERCDRKNFLSRQILNVSKFFRPPFFGNTIGFTAVDVYVQEPIVQRWRDLVVSAQVVMVSGSDVSALCLYSLAG